MPYLVFDVEGRVSAERVMRTENLAPVGGSIVAAVSQHVAKLCADSNSRDSQCFVPARFHEPVTIVALLVDDNLNYLTHLVIDHNDGRGNPKPELITAHWWQTLAWAKQQSGSVRVVSFNGVRYDIPVLETTAIEHGIDISGWLHPDMKPWDNGRTGKSTANHFDLSEFLTGPSHMGGGLNFWARLCGLPGKLDSGGAMVQQMLDEKKLPEIGDYCVCDVLNTYGLLFHVLHAMRLVPAGHIGNPIFTNTVERMIAGRGPEAQRFAMAYSKVPF